jgi:hypothetical protein
VLEGVQSGPTGPASQPQPAEARRQGIATVAIGSSPSTRPETNAGPTISEITSGSSLPGLGHILLPATEKLNLAVTQQQTASSTETSKPQDVLLIDSTSAYLLRTYETGIGRWMDVFDCSLSYQEGLLNCVSSSSLLLNSTCALAARQLSLIASAPTWMPLAERYYGNSLGLLRSSLDDPGGMNSAHAMVATILLSSYELMAFPGRNYHRHFRGARCLVEALRAHESTERLTRASFWIYARHEVAEAMNLESPTMQDPKIWPKADFSDDAATGLAREDVYCNDCLRLCGEVVHFIFAPEDTTTTTTTTTTTRRGRKWAKEWSGLRRDLDEWIRALPRHLAGSEYVDHGRRRYWFPRAPIAGAMCYHHVSQIFLLLHHPKAIRSTTDRRADREEQIQRHAEELIDIALSDMPDSVLIPMVPTLFHAARWVKDSVRREEAIVLLDRIQATTGFHTQSKVQILKSRRDSPPIRP